MSIDDRYKVIGKAAEDYVAVRRELAMLIRKAQEFGANLKDLSEHLSSLATQPLDLRSANQCLDRTPFEEIRSLLRDFDIARQKRADLRQTLLEIGLEPKD